MSNDTYQQRQFFEESGPFPDFKDYIDNHLVILSPINDKNKSRSMDADFQFKLEEFNRRNKNHGKNI